MSPSEATNIATRKEWRELGFFYEYQKEKRTWIFFGSMVGLRKLCDILKKYSENPKNRQLSEHEHYGPYMYLEVITSKTSNITDHGIEGNLDDIGRLSRLIRSRLDGADVGATFILREEYVKGSHSAMFFEVKDQNFDPASADPMLK